MKKIYSANITPFDEDGNVDKESVVRLIEFNLSHGIDGFFFFGTMGEWAVLSEEMKCDLLKTATETIAGKVEVIVGISSFGMNAIKENIDKYKSYNANSYAVQLPGGWAAPADPVRYMHEIADAADKPVYLYYLPTVNGISLSKDQFFNIFSHKNIKGVKNSSNSQRTLKELLLLKRKVDFSLFEGQEWVADTSLAAGCDGALVGMAPLGGKLFKMIARAVDDGDLQQAGEYQSIMIDIFDGVYGKALDSVWSGQKYALTLLGIFGSEKTLVPREAAPIRAEVKERIESCIEQYKDYLV
jgi:4-hydroxy-tetrahydrodipicolinate synthase